MLKRSSGVALGLAAAWELMDFTGDVWKGPDLLLTVSPVECAGAEGEGAWF